MKTRSQLCALAASLLCISSIAYSQCGILLDDEAPPSDAFGHYSLSEWDFDGPGPLPPELLLGTDRGRVMAFDGTKWRQVGPRLYSQRIGGRYNDPVAFDFVNFQDKLHVITSSIFGYFGGILRFNGDTWDVIPTINDGCGSFGLFGQMRTGTVWNDRIVVAGSNLRCGSQNTLAMAWDGASWQPLGDVYTSNHSTAYVRSIFSTSDGRLFIAGTIPLQDTTALIAEFVDGTWVTRVTGTNSAYPYLPSRFQEIDGALYALIPAAFVSGQPNVQVGVLREDPQTRLWTPWHTALDADSAADSGVQLVKVGNTWYLAANRGNSGMILTREGDTGPWVRSEPVTDFPVPLQGLKVFDGSLIAIGSNSSLEQCYGYSAVYQSPLSNSLSFRAFPSRFSRGDSSATSLSGVKVTRDGLFSWWTADSGSSPIRAADPSQLVTTCTSSYGVIAHFSGEDWTSPPLLGNAVFSLLEYDQKTLAFGLVLGRGSLRSSHGVALWNSGRWDSFPPNLPSESTALRNVHSAVVHQDQMLASVPAVNSTTVLRWNGESWITFSSDVPFISATLVSVDETLYAYTNNTTFIARFDGTSWILLPAPPGLIRSANNINGELFLNLVESSTTPVIKLENDTWVPFSSFPSTAKVRSLAWHQGELFAGLEYNWGTTGLAPLMVYSDGTWHASISTLYQHNSFYHPTATINSMHSDGQTLHLAGNFSFIGGLWAESWIRFYSGPPRLTSQPQSTQVLPGNTAYFSIRPQVYHDPNQTYLWHANSTPLADGPSGTGSIISGATTPYLRISNISAADQGEYTLIITNDCGSTTSSTASLSLGTPYCPADFNQDGGVDLSDVEAFFIAWENGLDQADVDQSGGVDGTDIQAFFPLWEAGGC